jgi:putative ABC transport system permease protein
MPSQFIDFKDFWIDMLSAMRRLYKTPGTTFLAILTLALGIGANTAMFTVIENVLLRPLPYAEASRLVFIGPPTEKPGFMSTSWLDYRDVRAQSKLLQDVADYFTDVCTLEARENSQTVIAAHVTPNVFPMLGIQPLLGRTFTEAEGQNGAPEVALLSEALWKHAYHADTSVIGKTVNLSGRTYSIVGIMPGYFGFPESAPASFREEVWVPLHPTIQMLTNRGYRFSNIVGQLKIGASVFQLQTELDVVAARIRQTETNNVLAFHIIKYQDALTGRVALVLYALFASLALVLLIACANLSNLLIANSLSRQWEFALRAALGASRWRLVRPLLAEGLVLSLMGCGVAILLAQIITQAVRLLPEGILPRAGSVTIHWSVILVLSILALIVSILSSIFPALLIAKSDPRGALQLAAGTTGSASRKVPYGKWLVAGEIGIAMVLLVGSGLLFHTLWNLEDSNLGFDASHVTTFAAIPSNASFRQVAAPRETENTEASLATITYVPILDRIREIPGVTNAALITTPPLSGAGIQSSFEIVDQPVNSREPPTALVSAASSDYARAMSTPVLIGRMIEDSDGAAAPYVAVVNQSLVNKYFGGDNPTGREISLGGNDTGMSRPYRVVGVLADQVEAKVGSEILPLILLPTQQIPVSSLFYQPLLKTAVAFVVKTRGEIPVTGAIRSLFHANAPDLVLDNFQTMQQAIDDNTFSRRLALYLIGTFAGIAVAMVLAGMYGVLTQLSAFRRHEIGVRMALGSSRFQVTRLVLREGFVLLGSGLIAGMFLSVGMGRWIGSFLYQVRPTDILTYIAAVTILLAIGLIATLVPACKAASIDPMQVLRGE